MKLIILDRDGVINYDSDKYIKSAEEWKAIPGSLEAIGKLNQHGYHIVIATNQSGIARGKFSMETLNAIHMKMHTHLAQFGGVIEAIFICPHGPDDDCRCRKPAPGLFFEIKKRLRISLDGVIAVGDKLTDIEATRAAGATPVLVKTGKEHVTIENGEIPDNVEIYDDLAAVVDALIGVE